MSHILCIEDNDDNLYLLRMRLETIEGFTLTEARDGRRGVELAALKPQPKLILMDLNLPVINGWEATRILKENPATKDIPIIALTAHAMAGDRERALAVGCNEFDTKPINFDRLIAKILSLIEDGAPAQASDVGQSAAPSSDPTL